MIKLPLLLRFFSFILVIFFLPLDIIFNNDLVVLIKKFIYTITLFTSLTKLCDTLFLTLAKRQDDKQPYNPLTFYSVLFITLLLTIISLTLINSYIDRVQFYIILLMIVIRITEIKLSYTNNHILNVICAVLFDSLAGCLSFELVTPTPIIHTFILGTSLACINGALLVAYILKTKNKDNDTGKEEENNKEDKMNSKKKRKQKVLLCKEIVLNNNLPSFQTSQNKHLLKWYQILTILSPAILGLCVTLKFISIYYYLTFLIIFPATHLFTKANKSVQNELLQIKDIYGQTAFISLAFIIIILIARMLSSSFPLF